MIFFSPELFRIQQLADYFYDNNATSEESAISFNLEGFSDIDLIRQKYFYINRTIGNKYWLDAKLYEKFNKRTKAVLILFSLVLLAILMYVCIGLMQFSTF